ncbi:MAG TPA: hypothetical protein VHG69_05190 [Thermoleophilaceae bacterium]|nr:hypothetical protein [Thermoleophilaceae bacterium]
MIGAGDCPHCGGDVVFALRGEAAAPEPDEPADKGRPKRRKPLRRLRRR